MAIDRFSRDRAMAYKQQLEGMSDEELQALEKSLVSKRQPVGLGSRLGAGLQTASNLFLQQGGLKPPQQEKASEFDELIKLEKFKTEQEMRRLKLEEAQREAEEQAVLASEYEQRESPVQPISTPMAAARVSSLPQDTPLSTPSKGAVPAREIESIEKTPEGKYKRVKKLNPDYEVWRKTMEGKTKTAEESRKGALIAEGNVKLVSGALNRLAKTYADAVKEGGAGNIVSGLH